MTPKELNTRLIAAFPELERVYKEQTEWQEGDDTGSHVVYGDILVPVLIPLLKGEQYKLVKKYTDFLEELLATNDEYATDVVATSVIESVYFDEIDKAAVKSLLGDKCMSIWAEYENE